MPPTTPFPIDLRKLLHPFRGEWVALSQDEKQVLGHGRTIDEALAMAKRSSPNERPLIIKVPDEGSEFILI